MAAKRVGRKVPAVVTQKKMLVVGDFPVMTGFGTVVHNLVAEWKKNYDLYIMGVNYNGDWNKYVAEYKIWPASHNDDVYGFKKIYYFLDQLKPDIVFILNDPWVAVNYKDAILKYRAENTLTKFFLYAPIDAPNVKREYIIPLNDMFDRVITYTEFGRLEMVIAGLTVPCDVVPHGVDTAIYKPMNKKKAKAQCGLPEDTFIVLTNCRNQPRKRLDLTMQYFSEWIEEYNLPENVRWYYHGAIKDAGWDILQLAHYFGINDRIIVTALDHTPEHAVPVEHMNIINNAADIYLSTSVAEGWQLPLAEAMATRTASLVPDHSALSEWPRGGVHYIDAPTIQVATMGLNTIHFVPDKASTIAGLQSLYESHTYREEIAQKGYLLVNQDKYRWKNIAKLFMDIFEGKVQ